MLGFVIVTVSFCLVQGDLLSPAKNLSWITCDDVNYEADLSLAMYNADVKLNGETNMEVDGKGFQSTVGLYVLGWKLPMGVTLTVSKGNLTGMETMVRSANAVGCATYTTTALDGIFEYGPELSLSYEFAKAKFLGWEVHGKFVMKPKVKVHVFLLNDTVSILPSCNLESIQVDNVGPSEYFFKYADGNSWTGWLISKLLTWGLQQNDDTPMITFVEYWSQSEIGTYLVYAWCQPY